MLLVPFLVLKGIDHYWKYSLYVLCVPFFGFKANRSLLEI